MLFGKSFVDDGVGSFYGWGVVVVKSLVYFFYYCVKNSYWVVDVKIVIKVVLFFWYD